MNSELVMNLILELFIDLMYNVLITRLGLKIKMNVNVQPERTYTHIDVGRIRIHKCII